MNATLRYFLDTDDDGHWYLVAANHPGGWRRWKALPRDNPKAWVPPLYARRIDGPEFITFENPLENS